ncbi:MAG: hypothetical protein U9R17_15040 [Thermodesulfobacteriota bacterium]|nr:hypothetical protein [Thermodesulfobacteriota bacterium]
MRDNRGHYGSKRGQATLMQTCKRYFREFEESEVDVVDGSPALVV